MYFTPYARLFRSPSAPFAAARRWDQNVERFLQQALVKPAPSGDEPRRNLEQDEKSYQLTLDLPGITREQLTIDIEANQLRIETKPESPRAYRANYEFPVEIDAGTSSAKLENGVLTLHLAKQLLQPRGVSLAVS